MFGFDCTVSLIVIAVAKPLSTAPSIVGLNPTWDYYSESECPLCPFQVYLWNPLGHKMSIPYMGVVCLIIRLIYSLNNFVK